jgi:hypothetical protein
MILACLAAVHLAIATAGLHYSDFTLIHATSVALHNGAPAYRPLLMNDGVRWNMNPPQLNFFTWPLAAFPLETAATVFRVANLLALACATLLVLSPRELATRRGGWMVVAALASPALVMQMGAGQVAGILSLVAAVAWRGVKDNRPVLLGAGVGVLCVLKPFFGTMLLWLLITRRARAVVVALGAGTGMVALSIAAWGLQAHLDWLQAIRSVTWFDSRFNLSWTALAILAVGGAEGPSGFRAIVGGSAALAILIAAVAARTRSSHSVLQLCMGSIIAAPLGWLYYLCIPGPLLMRYAFDGGRWPVLAWLLWIPLPLLAHADTSYLLRLTMGSVYAWGMLMLTLSILRARDQPSNA